MQKIKKINPILINWGLTLGEAGSLSVAAGDGASAGLPWRRLALAVDQREGYGGPEVRLVDRLLGAFDLGRGLGEEDRRLQIGLALTTLGVIALEIGAGELASDLQITILLLFPYNKSKRLEKMHTVNIINPFI